MTTPLFGWDLVIQGAQADIKTNEDILVCFTHLVLISNGFKCIGLGESKVLEGDETGSEALPSGWSAAYAIRYLHQGRLYLFKATKLSGSMLINLVRVDERRSAGLEFNGGLVAQRTGDLKTMLPKHSEMMQQIKTELIEKLTVSKNTQEAESQTPDPAPASSGGSSLREPPSGRRGYVPPGYPSPIGVGEFDLNPFGRNPLRIPQAPGGGGMLFQPPFGGGRFPQGPEFGLPPGAIPPGARFDPFRPPDVDRRRNPNVPPDNDDLMPPDYEDMFM